MLPPSPAGLPCARPTRKAAAKCLIQNPTNQRPCQLRLAHRRTDAGPQPLPAGQFLPQHARPPRGTPGHHRNRPQTGPYRLPSAHHRPAYDETVSSLNKTENKHNDTRTTPQTGQRPRLPTPTHPGMNTLFIRSEAFFSGVEGLVSPLRTFVENFSDATLSGLCKMES